MMPKYFIPYNLQILCDSSLLRHEMNVCKLGILFLGLWVLCRFHRTNLKTSRIMTSFNLYIGGCRLMDPVPLNGCRNDYTTDKPFLHFIQSLSTLHCPPCSLLFHFYFIERRINKQRNKQTNKRCDLYPFSERDVDVDCYLLKP